MDLNSSRLTLIEDLPTKDRHGNTRGSYRCICGNFVEVNKTSVNQGKTKSCGCLRKDAINIKCTTHGLSTNSDISKRKAYKIWVDIKRRCYNTENISYPNYGGRGITMKDGWVEDVEEFTQYVLNLPDFSMSSSLDRVNGSIGYIEGNLRWASDAQQARNLRKKHSNTSGVSGVSFQGTSSETTRVLASWYDMSGKRKAKSFSVKVYGLLPAFKMAVVARSQAIINLNLLGAGYSEYHGK